METVEAALRLATARGRPDLSARLAKTRDRLAHDRVRVLIIGEFKQGKSQLVNALVRAPVCPVDDDIATSVPTAVHYAETTTVTLIQEDARPADGADPGQPAKVLRREVPVAELARYVS